MSLYTFTTTPISELSESSPYYGTEGGRGLLYVGTFCLPRLVRDASISSLSTHTGPFMARPDCGARFSTGHKPGDEPLRETTPFYTAPQSRVHVLTADVAHPETRFLYRLVIHNRVFEKMLDEHRTGVCEKSPPIWKWKEWGPEHTRFFMNVDGYRWLRFVLFLARFMFDSRSRFVKCVFL